MHFEFSDNGELLILKSGATVSDLELLMRVCSATKMKWEGKRQVPGKHMCMFRNYQIMPAGLWRRVHELKKTANLDITISNFKINSKITKEFIDSFITNKNYKWSLAPHQLNAVFAALKFKKCSQAIGTSGGKTFITMCIASIILNSYNYAPDKKFLVIVPSQLLCSQGFNDFEEYQSMHADKELKVYKIFSGARNAYRMSDANVVFGTYHSLSNMPEDFFEQFVGVFVDEGHKAIDATIGIVKNLAHCTYRFAFSGSLPPLYSFEMLMIESYIGAYIYEFKTAKLRDAGFVADFTIVPVTMQHSPDSTAEYYQQIEYEMSIRKEYNSICKIIEDDSKAKDSDKLPVYKITGLRERQAELYELGAHKDFNRRLFEEEYLFTNQTRLNAIADFVNKLDKNTLILARRKNEVRGIHEAIDVRTNKNAYLIMGGVNNKEEIITSMKQSGVDDYIITGNVDMVGTGVSVTNLSYGVYCGIGKSTYVAIQTTGRIIRKHDEIPHAVIFDIRDDLQTNNKKVPQYARWSYSMAHSIARYETYKYEDYKMHDKGVTINI